MEVGDLPVHQVHVALRAARQLRVVRHEQDRRAHLVDLLEQVHHLARHERIQVAGGLIRQQERRVAGDRPRDRDALLLATGQLRRHMFHARGETDELEGAGDTLAAVGGAQAAVTQRHLDVVAYVEIGNQVEALEDEADALVAQPRTGIVRQLVHVGAVQLEAAGVEALE
jgi:hypothetical protein